ncbi:MAG TPA: hypothetical protein VGK32_03070 [Vicinamibacterales bacterium]|jgi:hypothetical protein
MAYPYHPPVAGRKDIPAGPGRLWKRIPQERRIEAATAFWQDEEESMEQQAEALLAIAAHYRFRVKTVRSLPLEKRVHYLAALPGVSDTIAGRVLVAYHLAHQRPMLGAFLDAVGIAHDNGVLTVEELKAPEPKALAAAAETLRKAYPKEDVELYFQTLIVQDSDTWGGLVDLLEPAAEVPTGDMR